MSSDTPVNNQITDAVTQANVKVIAEAPAMAVGSIYQTLAHATGILFENAVSAQQQMSTVMQATVTQGVMQIYSVDTMDGAGPQQVLDQLKNSTAKLSAASEGNLDSQIEDAVKQNLRSVLDSAGDVSFAVRSAAEAMQSSLSGISSVSYDDGMRTLQLAASAACLHAMIADPGQADAYAKVLDEIRRLS